MSDFWKDYEPEPSKTAPVQEPVNQRAHEMALRQWEHWKQYALELQEKLVKYEGGAPMVLNTTPPKQPAPVQEPVALGKPTDEMVQAATDEYDEWAFDNKGTTECIRAMLVKALKVQPAAQPAPEQDEHQAFIDSLPTNGDDKMYMQIHHWARQSYKRHQSLVRGQMITAADASDTHIIWAALRWAKENASPAQPAPVQEPVYHLRQFGDVTKEQLDRYMETGDINPQPAPVQAVQEADVFDDDIEVTGPTTIRTRYRLEVGTKLYTTPPAQPAPVEPDWKAEYLKSVESGCITLDELREARAELAVIKQALAAQQEHEPENEPHVSLASVQEPVARTDQQIVDQTEELAVWLLSWCFNHQPETDTPMRESTHPFAERCWAAACHIQEMLTATDPENSVAELDAETTPPKQPAVPDAIHHTDLSESLEYIQGWNDCRQAMLEMMK